MARRSPGRLLTLLGVLTLVAGLVGSVVLVAGAAQRRSNAVQGLARAPVGCDTTLDFAETGEYLVFVERSGSIDQVRGDCDVESDYDVSGSIDVIVELVDPDGDPVELDRVIGSVDYSIDGFVGDAQFTVDIGDAGDHVMRVESDDGPFAVAVGPDPSDGVGALFGAAAAAGLLGVVVGLGLVVSGRRRRSETSAPDFPVGATAPPWSPVGQVPQGPPTYSQPGGPVNYGRPSAAPGNTPPPAPPAHGWQPGPPGSTPPPPPGVPAYRPAPQASPSPPPQPPPPRHSPPPTPQIPGEPNWGAPGQQSPPPTPTNPTRDTDRPDATERRRDLGRNSEGSDSARPDDDETTVERPRWDRLPPPE